MKHLANNYKCSLYNNKLVTNVNIVIFTHAADVLSEDVILKWYREVHSQKGKGIFLDQMKKFVEWLENAEEGTFFNYELRVRFFCLL